MILLLNTYGTSINFKQGAFLVANKEGARKVTPDKVRTIVLHKGTKISSDAALLAIQNQIDVVFADKSGNTQGRIWSHQFGSISDIRLQQLKYVKSAGGQAFMKKIILERVDQQLHLLKTIAHDRPSTKPAIEDASETMRDHRHAIEMLETDTRNPNGFFGPLRGLEGNTVHAFLRCTGSLLPEQYRFEKRSKRPAKDMFNCLLNYLYGILYSQVEQALIQAGIDPYLGIMHRNQYNRPVLAFDMIERYRIWAEAVVIQLCFRQIPEENMFSYENDGYWLEGPGKKVVVNAFDIYMNETVQMHHRRRSRYNHIHDDAYQFAQYLLTMTDDDDTAAF